MKDNLKVVTFNIRCVWKGCVDGINGFIHRAGMIYEKVMNELPDVILFQELTQEHLELLKRMLPEYSFFGHFREEDFTGEGIYTAARDERIQVLGFDSYWISPTPYVPGSRFENQSVCPRTCLTLKIRDRLTNKVFKAVNLHLDHISDEARIAGIHMVLDRIYEDKQQDDIPVLIGGDFNALPDSETIKYCNGYKKIKLSDVTDKIETTFHNYGKIKEKIDYIYVTESLKNVVKSVYVWDDSDEGIYLSDHYPICVEFIMQG